MTLDTTGTCVNEQYMLLKHWKQTWRSLARNKIFSIINVTGLAIFISCLGLFGLAAFSAERRIKEVGIRKVLGASVVHIARLLSTQFVLLISVSLVLAFPLAWWAMNRWLENFVYHVEIQWWVFLASGLVTIGIALLTISFHALRAAYSNPVDSLRAE
jgi:putative ABC transport system permease protein